MRIGPRERDALYYLAHGEGPATVLGFARWMRLLPTWRRPLWRYDAAKRTLRRLRRKGLVIQTEQGLALTPEGRRAVATQTYEPP